MKKMILAFISLLALGMTAAAQADSIQLGFIDTNDCARAQNEISLLNSAAVQVAAVCSDYAQGAYVSNNGQAYDYRLYTTVTIAGTIASGTVIQLAHIDTNNPAFAQSEVALLNSSAAQVDVQVQGPGSFAANNGQVYAYRLYTTVTVK